MTVSAIYLITNLRNGKMYVGSSKDLSRRIKQHLWELKTNRHPNPYLQNAYNKGGKFLFKLLERCEETDLLDREEYWVKQLDCLNPEFGYNVCYPRRLEFTDSHRHKMSESRRGRKHSDETKRKIGSGWRGKKNPVLAESNRNRTWSYESQRKLQLSRCNFSEEEILYMYHLKQLGFSMYSIGKAHKNIEGVRRILTGETCNLLWNENHNAK